MYDIQTYDNLQNPIIDYSKKRMNISVNEGKFIIFTQQWVTFNYRETDKDGGELDSNN